VVLVGIVPIMGSRCLGFKSTFSLRRTKFIRVILLSKVLVRRLTTTG